MVYLALVHGVHFYRACIGKLPDGGLHGQYVAEDGGDLGYELPGTPVGRYGHHTRGSFGGDDAPHNNTDVDHNGVGCPANNSSVLLPFVVLLQLRVVCMFLYLPGKVLHGSLSPFLQADREGVVCTL